MAQTAQVPARMSGVEWWRLVVEPGEWVEPTTRNAYPLAFEAYRQKREREERWPSRHERLGHQVERHQWQQWTTGPQIAVTLAMRPTAPPRIQRVIREILRAIRNGRSANQAIHQASQRLRVKSFRVRSWIAAHIECRTA